jgi:acyl carrier protein
MVFEKIREVIVEQLGVEESEVTMETSFQDLGADSLDLAQIIIELEEAFEIEIGESEDIKTVGDAVKYVESKK